MKTRITLFLALVALITLSFTFASVDTRNHKQAENINSASASTPVGGLVADEVVK